MKEFFFDHAEEGDIQEKLLSMPPSLSKAIAAIGLSPFSKPELRVMYNDLCRRIDVGMHRNGPPTQSDGGVLAIRTGIPLLSQTTWEKVLPGSETIVCAYGGTNWIVGYAVKDAHGSVSVRTLSKIFISIAERQCTFEGFVQLMAKMIIKTSVENNLTHVTTAAISLGFPHTNERTKYGIEGNLTSAYLSKGWAIYDWDEREDKHLGKALIEHINQSQRLHLDEVVFLNDTCAVALDIGSVADYIEQGVNLLPVGMVCGTGTNICLGDHAEMVNLEIGEAYVAREDAILVEMIKRGLIPSPPVFEHYTGIFILYRLSIAVELLDKQGILRGGKALGKAIRHSEAIILSKLASKQVSAEELHKEWEIPVKDDLLETLQLLAQHVLYKAGQVYGLLLSSVVQKARKAGLPSSQWDVVHAEGSVLHDGYQVKEVTEKVCQQLGQSHLIISKSSSLAGVAALAMSLKYMS